MVCFVLKPKYDNNAAVCYSSHCWKMVIRRSGIKFTDIAFNQKMRVIWMLAGPHVMSSGILTVELGKKETNKE